jgi:hypothetical protein
LSIQASMVNLSALSLSISLTGWEFPMDRRFAVEALPIHHHRSS